MHPSVYKRPLLWLLAVLLVALRIFYYPAPQARDIFHFQSTQEVCLTGRVESFPVTKKDRQNVILRVYTLNKAPVRGRVYARLKNISPQWKDTLEICGKLQEPYGLALLGNFNWKNYLALKQVFVEIKSSQVRVVRPAAWGWRVVRRIRHDLLRVLQASFSPAAAGIISGVLLGERGEMDPTLYAQFQDSGAIHLLVASGGNVGFVTLLTLGLGMWLGLRRRPLLLLALGTAGVYTLIAGADAPLLRAYLMTVCGCVGYFLGRNSGVFQGLLLACLLIVGFSPAAVFDVGFEMSFLATASIIVFLSNYRVPSAWPKAVRFFVQILLATLASQLVLLPVFTNVFYKVSLTGIFSNMLLVPLASGLMGLGFAYYVFSCLHIGILLYYPCAWSIELFRGLVEFFASFRFSALPATAWNGGSVAAYYIMLFWVSQLPHKKFARQLFWPCLLAAGLSWSVGYYAAQRPQVYLLSEWNRRAVLVRTGPKTVFVFNENVAPDKLQRALYALGVSHAKLAVAFSGSAENLRSLSSQTPTPFVTLWPGDELSFPSATVYPVWALHQTKQGRIWQEAGYSGQKDEGISYCVEHKNRKLCVGEHGRFVQLPSGKTLTYQLNGTVRVQW